MCLALSFCNLSLYVQAYNYSYGTKITTDKSKYTFGMEVRNWLSGYGFHRDVSGLWVQILSFPSPHLRP